MVNKMLNVLVVEDEYISQKLICTYLIELGHNVIGAAMSYDEAKYVIENCSVDFAILDIKIKGALTGIDLASEILKEKDIPFIYLSAYLDSETISKAVLTNPYGYLVKPFEKSNLFIAIEIAKNNFNNKEQKKENDQKFLFLKNQDMFLKIFYDEIDFIESQKNYLLINVKDKIFRYRSTISDFKKTLPSNFIQIHKGFIVNLNNVVGYANSFVLINDKYIPLTKMYKEDFENKLNKR